MPGLVLGVARCIILAVVVALWFLLSLTVGSANVSSAITTQIQHYLRALTGSTYSPTEICQWSLAWRLWPIITPHTRLLTDQDGKSVLEESRVSVKCSKHLRSLSDVSLFHCTAEQQQHNPRRPHPSNQNQATSSFPTSLHGWISSTPPSTSTRFSCFPS